MIRYYFLTETFISNNIVIIFMDDEIQDMMSSHITEMGANIDPSIARFILSFENEIDSLRLSWEGKDIDYTTDPPTVKDFGTRLMNKEGIGKLTSFLKSIIANKGIPMSNFDRSHPYYWSALQGYRLAKDIFVNLTNYEIKSTEDADRILFPMLLVYMAHVMRGAEEGERKFWKGFIKESNILGKEKGGKFGL